LRVGEIDKFESLVSPEEPSLAGGESSAVGVAVEVKLDTTSAFSPPVLVRRFEVDSGWRILVSGVTGSLLEMIPEGLSVSEFRVLVITHYE
jgi:hypothetical protein